MGLGRTWDDRAGEGKAGQGSAGQGGAGEGRADWEAGQTQDPQLAG